MEKDELTKLLTKREMALLWLQRRYYFLRDYQAAIDRDLDEMKSRISVRNDVVQQLVYDTFDMLVNDLTSFCEGMTQRGGLLEKMKGGVHHFKPRSAEDFGDVGAAVFPDRPMTPEEVEEEKQRSKSYIVAFLVKGQRTVFDKLFPGAEKRPGAVVTKKDINHLIIRFKGLYKRVKTYRDTVSAHRYERGDKTVAVPTLVEVRSLIDEVENLMNQIRLILMNSSLAYHCFFHWNTKTTANDLLDLAVCGNSSNVRERLGIGEGEPGSYYWQLREKYYESIRKTGAPDAEE